MNDQFYLYRPLVYPVLYLVFLSYITHLKDKIDTVKI